MAGLAFPDNIIQRKIKLPPEYLLLVDYIVQGTCVERVAVSDEEREGEHKSNCMYLENFKGNSVKLFLGQLILSVRRMLHWVHYSLQPGSLASLTQEW